MRRCPRCLSRRDTRASLGCPPRSPCPAGLLVPVACAVSVGCGWAAKCLRYNRYLGNNNTPQTFWRLAGALALRWVAWALGDLGFRFGSQADASRVAAMQARCPNVRTIHVLLYGRNWTLTWRS